MTPPMPSQKKKEVKKEVLSPFMDVLSTVLSSVEWCECDDKELLDLVMIKVQNQRDIADSETFRTTLKEAHPALNPNWHCGFLDVLLYSLYSGRLPNEDETPARLGNINKSDYDALTALYIVAGDTIKPVLAPLLNFLNDKFFVENKNGKIDKVSNYQINFLPEE